MYYHILFGTIVLIFLLFGISTNLSFLIVIWKVKSLRRNSINSYLVSMAIADLTFLLTNKFYILALSNDKERAFMVGFAVNIVPEIVTELMMPLIAYDWYKAICLPTSKVGIRCNNKSAVAYILISWAISICVVIPMCLCLAFWSNNIYYALKAMSLVPLFVSIILCTALYYLIIRRVNSETVRLREQPEVTRNSILARNQIIKMLIANTAAFFVLLLPSKLNILYRFGVTVANPDDDFEIHDNATWWIISEIFLLINSTINPVVYTVGSRRYRQAFLYTLSSCFGCCNFNDISTNLDETNQDAVQYASSNSKGKHPPSLSSMKPVNSNLGDDKGSNTTERGNVESIEGSMNPSSS